MKKELRRAIAVLLSVVMLISNVPVTALADWWTDSSAGAPFAIGAQPAAADDAGEYFIKVGASQKIISRHSGVLVSHSWAVENNNPGLTIQADGASATVTGNTVGDYKITHTYDYGLFEQTEYFLIHVENNTAPQISVAFDLNGGSGTTPETIYGMSGDTIALPYDTGFSYSEHIFLGWSLQRDAITLPKGDNIKKAEIIPAGELYQLTGNVTLYAVWARHGGMQEYTLCIAVRLDGEIPSEPANHPGQNMSSFSKAG